METGERVARTLAELGENQKKWDEIFGLQWESLKDCIDYLLWDLGRITGIVAAAWTVDLKDIREKLTGVAADLLICDLRLISCIPNPDRIFPNLESTLHSLHAQYSRSSSGSLKEIIKSTRSEMIIAQSALNSYVGARGNLYIAHTSMVASAAIIANMCMDNLESMYDKRLAELAREKKELS